VSAEARLELGPHAYGACGFAAVSWPLAATGMCVNATQREINAAGLYIHYKARIDYGVDESDAAECA
jgi:hypothetical protein